MRRGLCNRYLGLRSSAQNPLVFNTKSTDKKPGLQFFMLNSTFEEWKSHVTFTRTRALQSPIQM